MVGRSLPTPRRTQRNPTLCPSKEPRTCANRPGSRPTQQEIDVLHRTCSTPACREPHHGRGLCAQHYFQARDEADAGCYQIAHSELRQHRGNADQHTCVDCTAPAQEWSYDYNDPDEVRCSSGTRYSLNPDHYQPRCTSCHRTRDHQERQAELLAAATTLEPQIIKAAIIERGRARKRMDRDAEDHWDDELERLTAQLLTG